MDLIMARDAEGFRDDETKAGSMEAHISSAPQNPSVLTLKESARAGYWTLVLWGTEFPFVLVLVLEVGRYRGRGTRTTTRTGDLLSRQRVHHRWRGTTLVS